MNLQALAVLGSLVFVLTNLARYVERRDWKAVQHQLTAFAIGVGVVYLGSAAAVTNTETINGIALADLDAGSKLAVGLLGTSLFATVLDKVLAAVDSTRSSAVDAEEGLENV